jgi:hypothetical protein
MERILAAAIASQRPVLVNPTSDELRQKAEELRLQGRLICTFCRKPIQEPEFHTRRIAFGPRLEAVAHLHHGCQVDFAAAMEERAERQGV